MELEDFKPEPGYVVNTLQSLVDVDVTDSKELWLIQFPQKFPEFDGKEFKVKLDEDGKLGGIEDSSGKEFDLVSYASQDGDATVIIPSGEGSKIVGKISRFVSSVCFPEPEELTAEEKKKSQERLSGAVSRSSEKNSCLTQSKGHKTERSSFKHPASTRSSKEKSTVTGKTETPPRSISKRKRSEHSSDRSGKSMLTVSGSSDRSGKSKKKVKFEK